MNIIIVILNLINECFAINFIVINYNFGLGINRKDSITFSWKVVDKRFIVRLISFKTFYDEEQSYLEYFGKRILFLSWYKSAGFVWVLRMEERRYTFKQCFVL